MSAFARIKGRLSFRQVYVCQRCGARRLGDTGSTEVDAATPDEVRAHLDAIRPSASLMPVGWCSDGDARICDACLSRPRDLYSSLAERYGVTRDYVKRFLYVYAYSGIQSGEDLESYFERHHRRPG